MVQTFRSTAMVFPSALPWENHPLSSYFGVSEKLES